MAVQKAESASQVLMRPGTSGGPHAREQRVTFTQVGWLVEGQFFPIAASSELRGVTKILTPVWVEGPNV